MKKKTSSMMNAGRIIRRLALVCGMIVLTVTMIPSSALAESNGKDQYIGEAGAKSIALENAGITEQQASFIKAYLDYDDGRVVYDIEFYSGSTEYDYEIDALNGDILEVDRDIEYYVIPGNPAGQADNNMGWSGNTDQYIGETKAKEIALENAGITEQQATFIKAHLDGDDGLVVYDVEFYSGNQEYEYEIDAVTGEIRESDREIEYYTIPPRNTDRPITDNKTQNNPPQFGPPAAGNADTGEYIGEAKAKAIALSAAGRTEDQFRRIKVELDYDDGKVIYEVEFKDGRMEYEYEIDAVNGAVLEADVEYDD